MEQQIRFLTTPDGARIAYSVLGQGPPLIIAPPTAYHLERVWEFPEHRRLCEGLARHHTVILYDRWGTGLSDWDREDFSREADARVLTAVADRLALEPFALFAPSYGGTEAIIFAARHPERLSHLMLFGVVAEHRLPWSAILALVRADWPLAAQTIANALLRNVGPTVVAAVARLIQDSVSAETFYRLWERRADVDMMSLLPTLRTPTLVVSYRGDPSIPPSASRQIAASIPNARFSLVDGNSHIHLVEDVRPLLNAITDFLGTSDDRPYALESVPPEPPTALAEPTPLALCRLSKRETEALSLVAAGLSNKEIATRLQISVPTVERHLGTIYRKIDARGRAEAVAFAFRNNLAPQTVAG